MKPVGEFKCQNCGWVHMGVSQADVLAYVEEAKAEAAQHGHSQGIPNVEDYRHCGSCGASSATFVPAGAQDAPNGCTLRPIIAPEASSAGPMTDTTSGTSGEPGLDDAPYAPNSAASVAQFWKDAIGHVGVDDLRAKRAARINVTGPNDGVEETTN